MLKLFSADLKMLFRNRQPLFWGLAFPLMFTIIFGFFFGQGSSSVGTVALINNSNSQLAQNLEKTMEKTDLFKIQKETNIDTARDLLKKTKIIGIIEIPKDFGLPAPAPTKINVINDPANAQSNSIILGFLEQFLTSVNFKIQKAQPVYGVNHEKTSNHNLNYFDFVLIGLIGLALMNSSVQGVAISMAKYKEDKILKRITTTPLPTWRFIIAEVLSRLVLNLLQIAIILGVGVYLFNGHIYGNILLVFLFALLGAILFQSIGFVIASLSKTTDAAQGMSVAITIPMMFLAGVFFPIDQLPKWLLSIVQYLPLAPLLRMIRQIALDNITPLTNPVNIVIVLSWIVVMLIIASYKFKLSEE